MTFRKIIFWAHLLAGVISGLAIGIMCFTGAALAYEKQLIAWAERDARRVEPPTANAQRLPLDELQQRLRAAQPEARPMSIVIENSPLAAVAFSAGRTGSFYVDPYSGAVRRPTSSSMGRFMQLMVEWHRYLGFGGETSRPRGKLINGICNVAFCVLAITGLYLWIPRSWSWRALRPTIWFTQNSSAKARDWNWHNVLGFWSAPVLIVLTLTAMPISFRWAGNLIYTLTGTPAPTNEAPGPAASAPVELPPPPAGARPLALQALLISAQHEIPHWETITFRMGSGRGGGARPPQPGASERPSGTAAPSGTGSASRAGGESRAQPVTVAVREPKSWPRTATTTLTLNPYTGEVLRREGHADLNAARQVRAWTRFLHTGEALGWIGQLVAGLACLAGCVLVWTGFALAWRRFVRPAASSTRAS